MNLQYLYFYAIDSLFAKQCFIMVTNCSGSGTAKQDDTSSTFLFHEKNLSERGNCKAISGNSPCPIMLALTRKFQVTVSDIAYMHGQPRKQDIKWLFFNLLCL